jgi:glycosyltransferase involved in cell wall biosynthesis
MLSVLIPTYNYNALSLVKELHRQLTLEAIIFEIICLDDGSNSVLNDENKKINTFVFSAFDSLKINIGRSAIRNLLAKKAKYKWLLFLDADVKPAQPNFIKSYIACFKSDKTVFCGGVLYQNKKENFDLLRYKYGKKHEEVFYKKRNKNSEKYFFTSNFLIKKSVFNDVNFEEKLTKYGREDLLFSLELLKIGHQIKHLSNEVYHLGIDENLLFVSKTKQAMENIVFLDNMHLIDVNEMPLLVIVRKISSFKMTKIVGKFYTIFEKLTIMRSSVFFLSCMKISYVCYLKSKHE